MADTTVWIDGLRFPESPRWRDGVLFVTDMFANRVVRIDPAGGDPEIEIITETATPAGGLGWLDDGRLLVVSQEDRMVMRLEPDGRLVVHALLDTVAASHANDMVVTPSGRAYVGNFGFDFQAYLAEHGGDHLLEDGPSLPMAELALIEPDGTVCAVGGGLCFPNGLALLDDGRTLVVAESLGQRLTAFAVAGDGTLSDQRVWASIPGAIADGICADAEGAVWFADIASGSAVRVAEGGAILQRVRTSQPCFAVELGEDDGRTLFCCTAPSSDERVYMAGDPSGRIETTTVTVPRPGG